MQSRRALGYPLFERIAGGAQFLDDTAVIVDIRCCADPDVDLAGIVPQRSSLRYVPAIGAVMPAQAPFKAKGGAGGDGLGPDCARRLDIVRVEDPLPGPALEAEGQARIFPPVIVVVIRPAVGARST